MSQRSDRPRRARRPIATFELSEGTALGEPRYSVSISVEGREGLYTVSWGERGVPFDEPTALDMETWWLKQIQLLIGLNSGVQTGWVVER